MMHDKSNAQLEFSKRANYNGRFKLVTAQNQPTTPGMYSIAI